MAYASIFQKLNELEIKLNNISSNDNDTSQNSFDITSITTKLSEIENNLNKIQDIQTRLAILESKNIPPDLSPNISNIENKLQILEGKVVDTGIFLDKLNHIESNSITDLINRVSVLEQKILTPA